MLMKNMSPSAMIRDRGVREIKLLNEDKVESLLCLMNQKALIEVEAEGENKKKL